MVPFPINAGQADTPLKSFAFYSLSGVPGEGISKRRGSPAGELGNAEDTF
jgi:hypothetical protein